MHTDLIASLGEANKSSYALHKQGNFQFHESTPVSVKMRNDWDGVELSHGAKSAYEEDQAQTKKVLSFERKFMDALAQFTNYALHQYGFTGAANGKQAFLALHIMAKNSGIELPSNLVEQKDESLAAFKKAWNLDDRSSVEDIFNQMVRAFGKTEGDWGLDAPDQTKDSSSGTGGEVNDVKPDLETNFYHALDKVTSKLHENNSVPDGVREKGQERVFQALTDKLGLPSAAEGSWLHVAKVLGFERNTTVEEIYSSLIRILNF
jgi:hypothetical protein